MLRRNSALTVLAPKLPPPVALELSRCPKVLAPSREAGSTKASIAVTEKQAKTRRKLVGAVAATARKDVVLDVALDPRRRPATPSRTLCPAPRNTEDQCSQTYTTPTPTTPPDCTLLLIGNLTTDEKKGTEEGTSFLLQKKEPPSCPS